MCSEPTPADRAAITRGSRAPGQRYAQAEANFCGLVRERIGCTENEALAVLAVYRKARAVRLDLGGARYVVRHGALWDADVLRRALAMGVSHDA